MSEIARSVALTATSSADVSTAQSFGFPALMVKVVNDSTMDVWVNVGAGTTAVTATTSAGYLLNEISATKPNEELVIYAHRETPCDELPLAVAAFVKSSHSGSLRLYATDI